MTEDQSRAVDETAACGSSELTWKSDGEADIRRSLEILTAPLYCIYVAKR
jgi:hypothetical protein